LVAVVTVQLAVVVVPTVLPQVLDQSYQHQVVAVVHLAVILERMVVQAVAVHIMDKQAVQELLEKVLLEEVVVSQHSQELVAVVLVK
jgi:hypothetical protein